MTVGETQQAVAPRRLHCGGIPRRAPRAPVRGVAARPSVRRVRAPHADGCWPTQAAAHRDTQTRHTESRPRDRESTSGPVTPPPRCTRCPSRSS